MIYKKIEKKKKKFKSEKPQTRSHFWQCQGFLLWSALDTKKDSHKGILSVIYKLQC